MNTSPWPRPSSYQEEDTLGFPSGVYGKPYRELLGASTWFGRGARTPSARVDFVAVRSFCGR